MSAVTSSSISSVATLALHGERGEQQIVADGVDQARDSLRAEVDFIQQARTDDGLILQAGTRHAGIDVGRRSPPR